MLMVFILFCLLLHYDDDEHAYDDDMMYVKKLENAAISSSLCVIARDSTAHAEISLQFLTLTI